MPLLQKAKFLTSANHINELPEDDGLEIAFAGRSNAGKSSAINSLSRQNRLAYVSKQPGRTQLVNFFEIEERKYLVDLPGYGYAKVPESMRKHWQKTLPTYLQQRQSLVGLVIVMDIRNPMTSLDINMLDWFAPRQKPIHVLLTKCDKLSKDKQNKTLLFDKSAHKITETIRPSKIIIPPIVGVPIFFTMWSSGPSCLIGLKIF